MKKISIVLLCLTLVLSLQMSALANSDKVEPSPRQSTITRTIFGDEQYEDFNSLPIWGQKSIAKLKIYFPNVDPRKPKEGTAFLYQPNLLATAAHCLYDGRYGGWAYKVEIIFPNKPIKTVYTSDLNVPSQFISGSSTTRVGDWRYDYGVIEVSSNIFNDLPHFGLWANHAKVGDIYYVGGYPAGSGKISTARGPIEKVGTYDLHYRMDTVDGQSGGPVYDADGYVVGINNYGVGAADDDWVDESYIGNNTAAKMDMTLLNYLRSFY